MEYYKLSLVEVMGKLRDYMWNNPNSKHIDKLRYIMDCYIDHPGWFKHMQVYVNGIKAKNEPVIWHLNGKTRAVFIFTHQPEKTLPDVFKISNKEYEDYRNICGSNLDIRFLPVWKTDTLTGFIDMVYQEGL